MNVYELVASMLDHPPQTWRPDDTSNNHPQELVGQIVRRSVFTHDRWGQSPEFVIRCEDGRTWRWLAMHGVPKAEVSWRKLPPPSEGAANPGEFTADSPRVGDWIGARFEGMKKSAQGDEYEGWTVVHVRAEHAHLLGGDADVSAGPDPAAAPPVRNSGDGGPGVVRPQAPPPEELPNDQGEPTLSAAQVAALKASFDGCPDEAYRKKVGAEFVAVFGKASDLPSWRFEEASGWLADALAEAPF